MAWCKICRKYIGVKNAARHDTQHEVYQLEKDMQQAFKRRRDDFGQAINTSNQQLQLETIALILSSKQTQDFIRSNMNCSGENDEGEESDEGEEPMSAIEESLNEINDMVDGDEYEANESDNDEDDFNSIDEVNNYLENHLNKVDQPLEVDLSHQSNDSVDEYTKLNVELKVIMRENKVTKHAEEKLIGFFNKYLQHPEGGAGMYFFNICHSATNICINDDI
ncbi:hypothetical protein G6F56_012759 [Rhizopus delemar]|nr:hypothetical protein G6F56_012759 [Rhizopus delemar]